MRKTVPALASISVLLAVPALLLSARASASQKVETVDGVRLVHNAEGGIWGKTPKVSLIPIRTLGDVDTEDPNTAFDLPSDIALDAAGNVYVLDMGNHRIQKFDGQGKFLASIGRQGQGPGEFYFPASLEIDGRGFLYVADPNQQRLVILTPEGKDFRTLRLEEGLGGEFVLLKAGQLLVGPGRMRFQFDSPDKNSPKAPAGLLKVLDPEGKAVRDLGRPEAFSGELMEPTMNEVRFSTDGADEPYLAYPHRNRIEKYSADGKLLWRADRKLDYGMEVLEKGKIDRSGGNISISAPRINQCSVGIAVDGKGRAWVVTLDRQLKKEEKTSLGMSSTMAGGTRSMGYKVYGDTSIRNTDAYKLEVFDPDGVLLGEIPMDIFIDGIFIFGDRLFLLDKMRGVKFFEYRIAER